MAEGRAAPAVMPRWRAIPFVPQTAEKDCGAACLAMVLGFFGRAVRLDELRRELVGQRDGTDALSILDMARAFHLNGRGVKVPGLDDLRLVGRGAILHWRFSHFVVLDRLTRRGAFILDPAMGRRHVTREELGKAFTGVALLFAPAEGFRPDGRRKRSALARQGIGRYVRAILAQWPDLAKTLTLSIVLQAFALSLPLVTGLVVDRLVPTASLSLFKVLSAGVAAVAVFHFFASLVRARLILQLNVRLDERTTLSFLRHLVDLPYPFFQERSAGDLMMRLNSNTRIREILAGGGITVLLDSLFIGIYLVILLLGSLRIGLLVLGLGALRVGLFLLARRRYRDLMAEALEVEARSRSYQVQLLAGIETLKASGSERMAVDHWAGLFVRELNVALAQGRLSTLVQSTLDMLGLVSPLVVLLYGSHLVLAGSLTLGELLALSSLAMGFLFPLSTLVPTAFQLQLLGSYVARINDVLETPAEMGEMGEEPGRRLPGLSGRISLAGVGFAYGPKAAPAVSDVSIEIEPGRMVALVGPSGAGKSTLASLLVGLYRPLAGSIAYDGVDLGDLDLRWLRRQVGIVSQQPYLFGTTIRDNIALSDPALPLDEVIAAARLAHIHDDIDAMPLGYDTVLADGGLSLSGGQRQRIALARALVHRPPILLLDEATSAVDVETESAIERELRALDCTRIVIAHRLSTVVNADQILVLVGGRLVEQGSHAELLREGGWYARMVGSLAERG